VRDGTPTTRISFSALDGDVDRSLTDADVRRVLSLQDHSLWVIASHMHAGGYGSDNLVTLRHALDAQTTVEREWIETDAFLWYCARRREPLSAGR
jgi:hypothetical protein